MRYNLWRWQKWYSWLTFPIALLLMPLVIYNFEQRRKGKLPDEWYWADRIMLDLGWSVGNGNT